MADDRDAFGNPIGDGGRAGIPAPAPAPTPAPAREELPGTPPPSEVRPTPGPATPPPPSRSRVLPGLVPAIVRLFVLGMFVTVGILIFRSAKDTVGDVSSSISELSRTVGSQQPPQEPAARTPEVDYDRTPFGRGSMFRAGNLARAVDRAQDAAPAGARAAGMSVFPGYVVVTFKRRNGSGTMVSVWAGGRVSAIGGSAATGRKTFSLSSIPLSPMVRYVRARARALGPGARGPYAVLTDLTTTSVNGTQVKITTRTAAAWLIGFEGVADAQRAVRIDLQGRRIR